MAKYGVMLCEEIVFTGSRSSCIAEITTRDDWEDDDIDLVNLDTGRAESFAVCICGSILMGGNCWNCDNPANY